MTIQVNDFLIVDGESRRIAAAAPLPFAPIVHELRFGGMLATNCYRGFSVQYELTGVDFSIRQLRLAVHENDLEALVDGRLFGRKPSVVAGLSLTYDNIPLSYTGALLVDVSNDSSNPRSKPSREAKEQFEFKNGKLVSRHELNLSELPEEFTPSSVWIDYGVMLWNLPNQTDTELT